MGSDLEKGTTYSTGGVGGAGVITSANLNAHVDDSTIKPTFVSTKAERSPGTLSDNVLIESGGALYRMLLSTLDTLLLQSGSILQTVWATPYTANANLAVIPGDDTIPQNTEGTQILTLSITPRSAVSRICLTFHGWGAVDTAGGNIVAALFRTGDANALAVTCAANAANYRLQVSLNWVDSPGSGVEQTYTIRAGPNAGAARMNGTPSGRLFGGKAACTLIAQELR